VTAPGVTLLIAAWATTPALSTEQAIVLYEQGKTVAACAAFDGLYVRTAKGTLAWRQVLRYRGVCRFLHDDTPGATEAFDALLEAEPAAALSTDDFPPAVVAFFGRTKDSYSARVARSLAPTPDAPRAIHASPYTPFGAHQFERGDDGLGQFLLTGQAIGLAAGVGGLIAFESMKEEGGFLDYGRFRDPDAARLVQGIYLAGFATFAALWIYGVVDGARYTPALSASPDGAVIGGQGQW
jgi:hypothetical protein